MYLPTYLTGVTAVHYSMGWAAQATGGPLDDLRLPRKLMTGPH